MFNLLRRINANDFESLLQKYAPKYDTESGSFTWSTKLNIYSTEKEDYSITILNPVVWYTDNVSTICSFKCKRLRTKLLQSWVVNDYIVLPPSSHLDLTDITIDSNQDTKDIKEVISSLNISGKYLRFIIKNWNIYYINGETNYLRKSLLLNGADCQVLKLSIEAQDSITLVKDVYSYLCNFFVTNASKTGRMSTPEVSLEIVSASTILII